MQVKLNVQSLKALRPSEKPYEVRDTELTGLIVRVQPSGVSTFYADYRNAQGKRKRVKLGRTDVLTLPQARDQARVVLGSAAKGEDPAVQRKRDRQVHLDTFLDASYLPWAVANLKRGEAAVKRMKASFADFLPCRLDELTTWKAERWIMDRKKAGRTAATINRDMAGLKASLSKAVEWGAIPAHPLSRLRPLKTDRAPKVRYLSEDEEKRLMVALEKRELDRRAARGSGNAWRIARGVEPIVSMQIDGSYTDHLYPMVVTSLHTGLRQGELFSLAWKDVDLGQRRLTVQGGRAKSGQTRHIPLNRTVLEVLARIQKAKASDDLVFPNRDGKRFNNVKKAWQRLLADAQVSGFRWHDLRHHFASRLVQRGTDLNTVRALLGHSTMTMTLRYSHLSPQVMADAVARLDVTDSSATLMKLGSVP